MSDDEEHLRAPCSCRVLGPPVPAFMTQQPYAAAGSPKELWSAPLARAMATLRKLPDPNIAIV